MVKEMTGKRPDEAEAVAELRELRELRKRLELESPVSSAAAVPDDDDDDVELLLGQTNMDPTACLCKSKLVLVDCWYRCEAESVGGLLMQVAVASSASGELQHCVSCSRICANGPVPTAEPPTVRAMYVLMFVYQTATARALTLWLYPLRC